jgi:hypothetical protein
MIVSPCPTCAGVVDELEVRRDAMGLLPGQRVARPCGHLVAVVKVLPGGALELGPLPPEPVLGPGTADQVADDLAGLADTPSAEQVAGDLRRLAERALPDLPGLPPLSMMTPLLEAMTRAMADARVLGTGWIRLQADTPGGVPRLERVDPASITVREVP